MNQYWSSGAKELIEAHLNEHSCEPQEIKNVIEGNGQGLLLILELLHCLHALGDVVLLYVGSLSNTSIFLFLG